MVRLKRTSELTLCATILIALQFAPRHAKSDSRSVSQEVDAKVGYVSGATIHGDGNTIDSVDEVSAYLKYIFSPQVSKNLLLRFGVEWERFSFDMPDTALLPDVLQQASVIIGFDYQLSDEWLLRADIKPGVYSDFDDVSGPDLNAPLLINAAFLANADLQWFFGLRIDARSQYPVLPLVGVSWRFADDWTLNLVLPTPRLEFNLNENLYAYLGVDIKTGTFKVGDHFGKDRGRTDLNRATLDYSEVRIGPGFAWKIHPHVTIDAEGGCMVYRRFDYIDENLDFRSDPAVYFQLACHARF